MFRPDPRGFVAAMILACPLALAAPPAQPPEREFTYRTAAGDTLIGIAARFLVDPSDWKRLQERNRVADPRAIPVGTAIRMPVSRMRAAPRPLEVEAVSGTAQSGAGRLAPGSKVAEGDRVRTGPDGFVTLRLADGSRLTVPAASEVKVEKARSYGNATVAETVLDLVTGRVDASARPQGGADVLEVRSRRAVTAVRGTRFRVAALEADAVATEVVEGRVGVNEESVGRPLDLAGGFGTRVEPGREPLPPVKLLAAPDMAPVPALVERTLVRLPFGAVAGAGGYVAQVAKDAGFRQLVAEARSASPEAKFADLPDGDYHVRLRAVDKLGLEGLESSKAFRLKARPEPPLIAGPADRAKLPAAGASASWSASTEAAHYRLQASASRDFSTLAIDEARVAGTGLALERLGRGEWHWRVASVRADGDRGPWSDPRRFTIVPDPPTPKAGPAADGRLAFEWGGEAGQRYEFQLASEASFAAPLVERTVDEPRIAFAEPGTGEYFFRIRAVDADGFRGPWSAAQRLVVAPSPWWLLVLAILVLL